MSGEQANRPMPLAHSQQEAEGKDIQFLFITG
jgi:hypothetical protein